MKVKDLIELLKEYHEDAELQTDGETYFLSHYENVDLMSEEFDADVDEILAVLVDVVVLY